MAKKKITKKKKSDDSKPVLGPNKYPEATTAKQKAAAAAQCKFLGKYFNEGETICYNGNEWICAAGAWDKTGNGC